MDVLRRGFSTDVRSAVLDLKTTVAVRGQTVRIDAYGPYESQGPTTMPRTELEISASGPMEPVDVRLVTTEDNAYVEYRGATFEVGRDAWRRLMAMPDDAPKTLDGLGIDPEAWVVDVEVVGQTALSGAQTTEVSGTLDVEALLVDYNRMGRAYGESDILTPRQIDDVVADLDQLDFRAWVGEDGVLRRFASGAKVAGVAVDLDLRIEEPNKPVEIRVPTDAAPISELLQLLGVEPDALLGPGAQLPIPG